MHRIALLTGIIIMSISTYASAAVPTAPEAQLAQLEQRAAKAATSAAGEYAKHLLDAARSSISDAKISSASGKDKLAVQQIEMVEIQLNAADAKGAEKELLEKVAVRRSELKKLEARLARFQTGEEN
jgi:hypothetical protein